MHENPGTKLSSRSLCRMYKYLGMLRLVHNSSPTNLLSKSGKSLYKKALR